MAMVLIDVLKRFKKYIFFLKNLSFDRINCSSTFKWIIIISSYSHLINPLSTNRNICNHPIKVDLYRFGLLNKYESWGVTLIHLNGGNQKMMPSFKPPDNQYFEEIKYGLVDLRSDTVSRPTKEMRMAMFEAKVGDDVYGEDPTVNHLEKFVSEMFKKEAALFVPTGTMGNLIAILAHCDRRGCEVIMGDKSHTFLYEQGGAAQVGGVHTRALPNLKDGTFSLDLLEQSIRSDEVHSPITGLIMVENTHNMCGGKVIPLEWLNKVSDLAKKYRVPLHMDGARIFNAAAYLNTPAWKIAENFDSVQFCFSKGLGAPVGSILVGSKALIYKARRLRKVLGAGMRQAGVIAAPCLIALQSTAIKLGDDHRRARELAQAIDSFGYDFIKVDPKELHTNILMVNFDSKDLSAAEFCSRMAKVTEEEEKELKEKCVVARILPKSSTVVRIVFYHEINDADVERVIEKVKFVCKEVDAKRRQK